MTNGEKLKEIFPDIEFTEMAYTVHAVAGVTSNGVKGHISYDFWKDWWNAEYKKPNLSENPISSTTKNGISNKSIIYKAKESKDIQGDLDKLEKLNEPTTKTCESCRHYGLHHEICNYCYKCSLWKGKEPTTKKCTTCAYREIDGKPHEMCKSCVCGNRYREDSTTKNNLPHCQCTDAEIANSFIEDVEAVKDQLPCGNQMDFPDTFDEFAKDYGFKDKDEIYTNGSELIPVFRVKQWLEHISTTRKYKEQRTI